MVVASPPSELPMASWTIGFVADYVAAMFFLAPHIPKAATRLSTTAGPTSPTRRITSLLLVLISALRRSRSDSCPLGAFLRDESVPKGTQFVRHWYEKQLEDYTIVFSSRSLLAFAGLKTQIGLPQPRQPLLLLPALITSSPPPAKFGGEPSTPPPQKTPLARRQAPSASS